MPRVTDITIRSIPLPASGQVTYDDEGSPLKLRISRGGAKTFIVMLGSGKRHTLGRRTMLWWVALAVHGMSPMLVVARVLNRLWGRSVACRCATVAEVLGHQRSGAMVTTAFDGFLDRRDRDPALVVRDRSATRNGVDSRRCDAVKPHQLLLDSERSER